MHPACLFKYSNGVQRRPECAGVPPYPIMLLFFPVIQAYRGIEQPGPLQIRRQLRGKVTTRRKHLDGAIIADALHYFHDILV